jgi:hypothetical protein
LGESANFICVLFGTKESYFDSKFKFLLIRISRDHISLQYKRMGLTRASSKKAFSFSEYSVNANSLIYHSYQENTLRKDGLCSKIKLLQAEIGFTNVWVNQGTFSKFKFLLIRISRDHISLQYKRMGLTQASKGFTYEMAFSFSEYSVLRIQNIALEAFFGNLYLVCYMQMTLC